jgi:hypothetical protein
MRPRDSGGTGGRIPQDHHRTLLDYARENGIPLAAEEFLPTVEPALAPSPEVAS